MKVILTKGHDSLGEAGEIVKVKDGYARNFLIPKSLAYEATKANLKVYEEGKKRQSVKVDREVESANEIAKEMNEVSLTASVKVGEEDKVFGSVTSQDIANLLEEKGFTIDKRDIALEEPIKALGIYNVSVKVHPEVKAEVKLWVIKQ